MGHGRCKSGRSHVYDIAKGTMAWAGTWTLPTIVLLQYARMTNIARVIDEHKRTCRLISASAGPNLPNVKSRKVMKGRSKMPL